MCSVVWKSLIPVEEERAALKERRRETSRVVEITQTRMSEKEEVLYWRNFKR